MSKYCDDCKNWTNPLGECECPASKDTISELDENPITWKCPDCGYLNNQEEETCPMCGYPEVDHDSY